MTSDRSIAEAIVRLDSIELPPDRVAAMLAADAPGVGEVLATGDDPTVAIIVPTYRDTRFLADALASVQQQTYPHWRCIIVDDASPEAVWPVVQSFADADSRFVFVRHGKNAGLAAARNTGLRVADETYVQFLDADDMLTPGALADRIAVLRPLAADSTVAGCHGHVLQCPEETTLADVSTWVHGASRRPVDWIESEGESPFTVHMVLLRTAVAKDVGGFDETLLNGAEDWEFWHRILRHGYWFPPCASIIGAYRQRRASMIRAHSAVHLRRADSLLELGASWVAVDPDVAVGNASMPIADARQALQRMIRAARWAGISVAQGASVAEAIDGEVVSFVGPGSIVSTRHAEIVDAARGGLLRGLGLSRVVADRLPDTSSARLDAAATLIAEQLTLATAGVSEPPQGAPVVDLVKRNDPDVAFVAETAADVARLRQLVAKVEAAGHSVAAVDIDFVKGDEGATESWQHAEVPVVSLNLVMLGKSRPGVVVACRPAGPVTLDLLEAVRSWGGAARFLDEPPRGLELEEAAWTKADVPATSVDELPSLVPAPGAVTPDRSPWPAVRYSMLLQREESEIDAASVEKLANLRDIHRGETAIIIGNGPSLNVTDLSLLERAPTFGVNAIFLAQDRLPAPITYYVVEDTAVFADNLPAIKTFKSGTRLFPHIYRDHFGDDEVDESTIFFRMNQGFYGRKTGTLCLPRFSVDASQRLYCGQSVTIINLQLAYWMGFSRVVLIGMDFSYVVPDDAVREGNHIKSMSDDPNHFHPDYFGVGKTWKDPKLDRVMANYVLAREMFECAGRQIVNATVGGKLELFDRMSLADAV